MQERMIDSIEPSYKKMPPFTDRTYRLRRELEPFFAFEPGLRARTSNLLYSSSYHDLAQVMGWSDYQATPIVLKSGHDFNIENDQLRLIQLLEDSVEGYQEFLRSVPVQFVAGVRPVGPDGVYATSEHYVHDKQKTNSFFLALYVDLPVCEQSIYTFNHLLQRKIEFIFQRLESIYAGYLDTS